MQRIAHPKVNLFLHIKGKRADGYHLLDSLVVFVTGGDVLHVQRSDTLSLECRGPFGAGLGLAENNLVYRAAVILRQKYKVASGAALILDKQLPIASGIGGGSADAASALHLLNDFWGLTLSQDELAMIGLSLGADIPVCLNSQTSLMSGIGETITEIPDFPQMSILLVNPNVAVSTAEIFNRVGPRFESRVVPEFSGVGTDKMIELLSGCGNDLQIPAMALCPEIGGVLSCLEDIKGSAFAGMSGSGATCFALFKTEADAKAAENVIRDKSSDWWVMRGEIVD